MPGSNFYQNKSSQALVFLSNKANWSEISSLTDIDPNRGFLKVGNLD